MKIICISPCYSPSLGGVETHVRQVAEHLVELGHVVTVFTTQSDPASPLSETIDGVQIERLPESSVGHKVKTWQWIRQRRAQLLEADSIHVHDVGWWLVPVLLRLRKKLFITFHGWEGQWPIRWQAKVHRWLIAKAFRASIHIGDWIKEFYWDTPQLVLYGGVAKRIKPSQADLHSIESDKRLKIVFLGRLVNENAVAEYCRLAEQLEQNGLKVSITWVGDGPLKKQCRAYGEVTGMVRQPQRQLRQADVVWSSSYLSILSAQALGKPVWALWDNELKHRYLASLPNHLGLTVAGSADSLWRKVYDPATMGWRATAVRGQCSSDWPPTWDEVTQQYLSFWKHYGK